MFFHEAMPSRYTHNLTIFDEGNCSFRISYTFTLKASVSNERDPCVFEIFEMSVCLVRLGIEA